MDLEAFWTLIESITSHDNRAAAMIEALSARSADDIIAYQRHFDDLHAGAYHWDVWGAAYIIQGGCSDDGFTDFRYGLISRGRAKYESALANPDSLADWVTQDDDLCDEEFGYAAMDAYARVADGDLSEHRTRSQPSDPVGDDWDFDDDDECAQRLPRIHERFGVHAEPSPGEPDQPPPSPKKSSWFRRLFGGE